MKKLQSPLFLLLLPVFFVFHGFVENYTFIRFSECLPLFGIYTGSAVIVFFVAWLFLKNKTRAALFAAFIMAFYLFFGALHDFLRKNNIFLHRYSLLLPVFAATTVLLFFYLKKRPVSPRLPLFLNVLLLLYLLTDGGSLLWKALRTGPAPMADYSFAGAPIVRCDSCPRPDIYYILFDDYSGNKTLKEIYHYDNSGFDSFLVKEGFRVQKNSFSNYCFTWYSMASILNYAYLDNLRDMDINPDDYKAILEAISKNRVVNFLYSQGYAVINYSPFDLPEQPSLREVSLLPAKTRLITNRTLLNYINRDLQFWMDKHLNDSTILAGNRISEFDRQNAAVLAETKEESSKKADHPRFIYAHLFLPHPPFLYDSLLRRRPHEEVAIHNSEDQPAYYLSYLPYTNACAKDLISTIKRNTNGKAVIIFMSDHGFRYSPSGGIPSWAYNNQNAVYFPDGDYRLLYDSISGVNQFRVVFNKLFRQNLPLLKDSTLFLRNKE